jgi:hypothetical protein
MKLTKKKANKLLNNLVTLKMARSPEEFTAFGGFASDKMSSNIDIKETIALWEKKNYI